MAENGQHVSLGELLDEIERDEDLRGGTDSGMAGRDKGPPADEREDREKLRNEGDGEAALSGMGNLLGSSELWNKIPGLIRLIGELRAPASPGKVADPASAAAQAALLAALRPYVSENRRRAIDMMIRISRLSESVRALR